MISWKVLAPIAIVGGLFFLGEFATVDRHDALGQLDVSDATSVSEAVLGSPYWISRSGKIKAICDQDAARMAGSLVRNNIGDVQFFNKLGRSLQKADLINAVLDKEKFEFIWNGVSKTTINRKQRANIIENIYHSRRKCAQEITKLLDQDEYVCQIDSIVHYMKDSEKRLVGLSFDELCLTSNRQGTKPKRLQNEPAKMPIWNTMKKRVDIIDYITF